MILGSLVVAAASIVALGNGQSSPTIRATPTYGGHHTDTETTKQGYMHPPAPSPTMATINELGDVCNNFRYGMSGCCDMKQFFADCKDNNCAYATKNVWVNNILGFDSGRIVCQENGGLRNDCTNCKGNGTWITCDCTTSASTVVKASIDISHCLVYSGTDLDLALRYKLLYGNGCYPPDYY